MRIRGEESKVEWIGWDGMNGWSNRFEFHVGRSVLEGGPEVDRDLEKGGTIMENKEL